jgi:hypothetical protein
VRRISLFLLVLALTAAARSAEPRTHEFKLTITGQTEFETDGKKHKVGMETVVRYLHRRDGRMVQIVCQSLSVKHTSDGTLTAEGSLDREKMVFLGPDGKRLQQSAANEPELRKTLEASFGTVLAKLELDEDGAEVKKTIVADANAKDVLENGVVTHCLLFHAAFPQSKNAWTRTLEYSMPGGAVAAGELKYEKVESSSAEPAPKDQKTVKVSGALTAPVVRDMARRVMARNVKMEIQGEQTYDTTLQEWVSGTHTATVLYPMQDGDRGATTAKCVMTITLERVAEKK